MGLSLSPSERRETGLLNCATSIYTLDAVQTKYLGYTQEKLPLVHGYNNVVFLLAGINTVDRLKKIYSSASAIKSCVRVDLVLTREMDVTKLRPFLVVG